MSEIILVGGSKDGLVTDGAPGMNSVHNIVLNDELTTPEYVDRYVPTNVKDREGREVYAHVGRYTGEESQSYWDKMDKEQVDLLIEQTKAERAAEEEARAAEEAAKAEEKPEENAEVTEEATGDVSTEEKPETAEEPVEEQTGDVSTEEKPENE